MPRHFALNTQPWHRENWISVFSVVEKELVSVGPSGRAQEEKSSQSWCRPICDSALMLFERAKNLIKNFGKIGLRLISGFANGGFFTYRILFIRSDFLPFPSLF